MRIALAWLLLIPFASLAIAATKESPQARPFRMGFTCFVYDLTPAAIEDSRNFTRKNGDIIAHHIEGVPWVEASQNLPLPRKLLDDWTGRKLATPPGGKVYLAISPGRAQLRGSDKAPPLPQQWKTKSYDDPAVKTAYLNYCRQSIAFFQPDYLAIGIEVNEIFRDDPAQWNAYVNLHEFIYAELKKDDPTLPIFASFTLHAMRQEKGASPPEFARLMPCNDVIAVSYYPFFAADNLRLTSLDWLSAQFDQFKKPYAIVETNDSAEPIILPQSNITLPGTPARQLAYYEKLLATAQQQRYLFVISFVHQDYDALWEKIKPTSPELFMAWRDCGLLDEQGHPRPAYAEWMKYFNRPLRPRDE
jgi:hypothetical protein